MRNGSDMFAHSEVPRAVMVRSSCEDGGEESVTEQVGRDGMGRVAWEGRGASTP